MSEEIAFIDLSSQEKQVLKKAESMLEKSYSPYTTFQ